MMRRFGAGSKMSRMDDEAGSLLGFVDEQGEESRKRKAPVVQKFVKRSEVSLKKQRKFFHEDEMELPEDVYKQRR